MPLKIYPLLRTFLERFLLFVVSLMTFRATGKNYALTLSIAMAPSLLGPPLPGVHIALTASCPSATSAVTGASAVALLWSVVSLRAMRPGRQKAQERGFATTLCRS